MAPGLTYLESLRRSLHEILEQDPAAVVLGEDILDPYGGAFKVTQGLSTRFPDRVFTTPICEASIVGMSVGLALRGLHPIVEIMFGDFVALAADQLVNHAAKYPAMYNGQVAVPLVVRTPMGGGRGYGPTHSQSLERLFFGIPHLKLIAASHAHDAGRVAAPGRGRPGAGALRRAQAALPAAAPAPRRIGDDERRPAAWPLRPRVASTCSVHGVRHPRLSHRHPGQLSSGRAARRDGDRLWGHEPAAGAGARAVGGGGGVGAGLPAGVHQPAGRRGDGGRGGGEPARCSWWRRARRRSAGAPKWRRPSTSGWARGEIACWRRCAGSGTAPTVIPAAWALEDQVLIGETQLEAAILESVAGENTTDRVRRRAHAPIGAQRRRRHARRVEQGQRPTGAQGGDRRHGGDDEERLRDRGAGQRVPDGPGGPGRRGGDRRCDWGPQR